MHKSRSVLQKKKHPKPKQNPLSFGSGAITFISFDFLISFLGTLRFTLNKHWLKIVLHLLS